MTKIPKEVKFIKGEKVKYTGNGFIGFNPENREMNFIEYYGLLDVYVKYNGVPFSMLVSRYEIEKK